MNAGSAELGAIDLRTLRLVPESDARVFGVIPLREIDDQLVLAACAPLDAATEQAMVLLSGRAVRFELAAAEWIRAAIDASYASRRTLRIAPPPQGSPHVLVTDDTALIRVMARAVLGKGGMLVEEAGDGHAALQHLASGAPVDLVLLDLDMPTLGGLETLRRIRENPVTSSLPVIILTGSDQESDRSAVIDAGADDYVNKPIVASRLLARVRAALHRR